ncbi:hypothetical protein JCM2811A_46460 [Methylorubrum rhodinum]
MSSIGRCEHSPAGSIGSTGLAAKPRGVPGASGRPGQAQTVPHLLLVLWLSATRDGVGSARAVARLCVSAPAYRWP